MEFLSGNQLVSGGLVLMLVGAALAYARAVPFRVYAWLRSRVVFSVQIEGNDHAYDYLLEWIHDHPATQKTKTLILKTKTKADGETEPIYTPLGIHWLFYRGRLVWFERSRDRNPGGANLNLLTYESIIIRTISRKRGLIEDLIAEAIAEAKERRKNTIQVYRSTQWGSWHELTRRKPRSLDSIILPANIISNTVDDLEKFYGAENWYRSVGIPYRRGYLLYGPPGNGKTSLVFAIASKFHKNIAILNIADPELSDSGLIDVLSAVPKDSILLVEDIDSAFNLRKAVIKGAHTTFSGLLNALDGVASSEGRVMFMTTNHYEKLDPALIRPGRIDRQIEIAPPKYPQIREMFLRFFPGEDVLATDFARRTGNTGEPSAAKLQEHFLQYREAERAAAEWV